MRCGTGLQPVETRISPTAHQSRARKEAVTARMQTTRRDCQPTNNKRDIDAEFFYRLTILPNHPN